MVRIAVAILALAAAVPAAACNDPAHLRAMKDQARAAERQADVLERLERVEKDRLKMEDRIHRERRQEARQRP